MAPSRGPVNAAKTATEDKDDVAVKQQSSSALVAARRNFRYLISPTTSKEHPGRFRTRALLRTLRYVGMFIFWRLVRWAKYVAVGSIVAAVSATAFGGLIGGIGWLAAPPTLAASVVTGTIWGVGKFGARRLHKKWKAGGGDVGEAAREKAADRGSPLKTEGAYGTELGPQVVPW